MKVLSKGAHGHIYMIEDETNNKKMALKLQDDQDMASTEVGTMKKLSQVFD